VGGSYSLNATVTINTKKKKKNLPPGMMKVSETGRETIRYWNRRRQRESSKKERRRPAVEASHHGGFMENHHIKRTSRILKRKGQSKRRRKKKGVRIVEGEKGTAEKGKDVALQRA